MPKKNHNFKIFSLFCVSYTWWVLKPIMCDLSVIGVRQLLLLDIKLLQIPRNTEDVASVVTTAVLNSTSTMVPEGEEYYIPIPRNVHTHLLLSPWFLFFWMIWSSRCVTEKNMKMIWRDNLLIQQITTKGFLNKNTTVALQINSAFPFGLTAFYSLPFRKNMCCSSSIWKQQRTQTDLH